MDNNTLSNSESISNSDPSIQLKGKDMEVNGKVDQHLAPTVDSSRDLISSESAGTEHEASVKITNGQPSLPKAEHPENETKKEVEDVEESLRNYPLLFESYQERFHQAYALSQKLFEMERQQRQTLNYYQRRNNALLDVLEEFEDGDENNIDALSDKDRMRLENLINMNPRLKPTLETLLNIDDSEMQIRNTYNINLLINEIIPELAHDEVDNFELNPQDIELWVTRHCAHLAISKYTPMNLYADNMKES